MRLLRPFTIALLLAPAPLVAQDPPPVADSSAAEAAPPAPPAPLSDVLEPLTEDRLFRDAKIALQVVKVSTGEEVYAWKADTGMNPASTMKVVTAAAALRTLGPSHRWTTTVLRDGDVNADGVLEGDLYVVGTGDPTLVVEKLWKLVYDLKLEGIDAIEGNVYFDDSYMDHAWPIRGWTKQQDIDNGPAYFATTGALSLNFNTTAVVVGPGSKIGDPARVVLETPAPGIVTIENELKTTGSGSRRWVRMEREVSDRSMTLELSGAVPIGATTQRYYRTVPDPTANFQAAFVAQLKAHGVKVRGQFLEKVAPERGLRQVVLLKSPPLSTILMDMNKYSNNFMAEQVLKTLGSEVHGSPGTTEKGLEVVSSYLEDIGIPRDEHRLVNGSGLSREIAVRPTLLTAVLLDMAEDDVVGHEFRTSLAIGGRDGTLWSRFRDEDEVDRMRGKTGTLNGVHCLAGYVEGGDGDTYAFAYLVNDLPASIARARQAHDRFVEAMLQMPSQPVAER